jgi:hypothetical protein
VAVGWEGKVKFGRGGAYAYRQGELIVRAEDKKRARRALKAARAWPPRHAEDEEKHRGPVKNLPYERFRGVTKTRLTRARLQESGIAAQLNHVLFASSCGCGGQFACPPHPALPEADAYYEAAETYREAQEEATEAFNNATAAFYQANPFYANPFYANPFYANPFYANPFYANPFYANPFYANPFYANPFYANAGGCCCGGASANPFYANPFYANSTGVERNPAGLPHLLATGKRGSSAQVAELPDDWKVETKSNGIRVAILDTGRFEDGQIPKTSVGDFAIDPTRLVKHTDDDIPDSKSDDNPDSDIPKDGLDPVAGHGTFIAGVIERILPGCDYQMVRVVGSYGEADEASIAEALTGLIDTTGGSVTKTPHFINMSFGGYSPTGMTVLAEAIDAVRDAGAVVVASAGNDSTCFPAYPAALPGVIAVGAVDANDEAATFTNYGPWVDAASLGVDIISTFFHDYNFDPSTPEDDFKDAAKWSGTSFAAPRVVAALAKKASELSDAWNGPPGQKPDLSYFADEAAHELILDVPDDQKTSMLGVIINPDPTIDPPEDMAQNPADNGKPA